jgi:N-methylhydantoinase B
MGIRKGDTLRHELAGAGGWGDPLERDPELVLRDVRNEFVSRNSARGDYGVAVLENPLRVDREATLALRARMRAERNWRAVPEISWERSGAKA